MLFGVTEMDAVGAGGAGGGGGGGGAAFFLQAPSVSTALSAMISRNHFLLCDFTLFPPCDPGRLASKVRRSVIYYFQLQLGWVLWPVKVSCCTLVPSASIVQISSFPDRLD